MFEVDLDIVFMVEEFEEDLDDLVEYIFFKFVVIYF